MLLLINYFNCYVTNITESINHIVDIFSEHWYNFEHMDSKVSTGQVLAIAAASLTYLLIFPRMVSTNELLGSSILLQLCLTTEDILVFFNSLIFR